MIDVQQTLEKPFPLDVVVATWSARICIVCECLVKRSMILTYASESPYNQRVVAAGRQSFPFGCVPLDFWLLEGAAALSLCALYLCHELLGCFEAKSKTNGFILLCEYSIRMTD